MGYIAMCLKGYKPKARLKQYVFIFLSANVTWELVPGCRARVRKGSLSLSELVVWGGDTSSHTLLTASLPNLSKISKSL